MLNGTHVRAALALVSSVALTGLTRAPDSIPAPLLQMAETERAFAKRARDTTVREAFIEFFADEAVGFEPDPVPARESLKKSTRPQPPGFQLIWEPRLGDVAASGDLGYLTGPAEYINPGQPNRYTNYFSVWKRQKDGEFRVILDIGINTPEKPAFAPGFVRASSTAAWTGTISKSDAETSLMTADKRFSASLGAQRAAAAYAAVMHPDARLLRNGFEPSASRDSAVEWLKSNVKSAAAEPLKVESAASGDLGYSWGKYNATLTGGSTYAGYYVRVWTRRADGGWQLVAEVTTPVR
jgi:ketosteroid isomerase-like protein